MTIAFASGKGGTGKTTFSTAFALSAEDEVTYLDCDVEEPDSHFFIKPDITGKEIVSLPVPFVNAAKCTGCGKCAKACRFNAVVMLGEKPLFFHELCHSCGGCLLSCPEKAINEEMKQSGVISTGSRGTISFYQGLLDVGNAKSPPLIRAVRKKGEGRNLVLIDSPPGSTCPMVTSVRDTDYVVLVTEPSPFGLHDLKLAVQTVRELGLAFGIIINKSTLPFGGTAEYCRKESIPVLLEVPESRDAAAGLSRGIPLTDIFPELKEKIREVLALLASSVKYAAESGRKDITE